MYGYFFCILCFISLIVGQFRWMDNSESCAHILICEKLPVTVRKEKWSVSNVSIIFYYSMLYYILFWTLMGFIIHFYIIFATNLLTGGPARIAVFLPISVFRRKRISNGVQTEWNLRERDFRNEHDPEDLDPTSRHQPGGHEVGGRALHPRGPHVAPPM